MLNVRVDEGRFAIVDGILTFEKCAARNYVLKRQLASGANGWVYAGEHINYGPCVVKVMRGRGPSWQARFTEGISEVSRLASAGSPWVAKAFDANFDGDNFYYSMKFVEGETLKDVLKQELSPRQRWRLGTQYVCALLNTRSVLHADPHAGNVIVAPDWQAAPEEDGQLTLIDFGPGWPLVKRPIRQRKLAMRDVVVKIARRLPGYAQHKDTLKKPHGSIPIYIKVLGELEPKGT